MLRDILVPLLPLPKVMRIEIYLRYENNVLSSCMWYAMCGSATSYKKEIFILAQNNFNKTKRNKANNIRMYEKEKYQQIDNKNTKFMMEMFRLQKQAKEKNNKRNTFAIRI